MRHGVVYRITNLENDKCYIGQTKNNLRDRWYRHCHRSSGCPYLKHAIAYYGKENFTIVEIASSWDSDSLKELEALLIKQENTVVPHGYNLVFSEVNRQNISKYKKGKSCNKGRVLSKEHKKKLSDIAKKRVYSVETRKKMSISAKKQVCSVATRQKLREYRKTYICSEETKKKISESHTGKKRSEEHRRKISEALKVRICSAETRQKLSLAAKNQICSEETRRKISEARKCRLRIKKT